MTKRPWVAALCLVAGGACTAGAGVTDTSTSSSGASGGGGALGEGGAGEGGAEVDPCAAVSCDDGEICQDGSCVPGCNENDDCAAGSVCCSGGCVDLSQDVNHCGMCDEACDMPANMAVSCQMGLCNLGACADGYWDCDGDVANGCEEMQACSCTPGETQPCYPGPPNTENNAPCAGGTRKCNAAGTAWSLCSGFVLPSPEICGNNVDEDCNATTDDVPDLDGDGWTACDNDCCETTQDCAVPAKVNPGAFEFVGNLVDDDCDPATSDATPAAACSTSADFSAVTAQQVADAIELCQTTTAGAPLPTRKWGVTSASFRLASGAAATGTALSNIQNWQTAILQNYGTGGVAPMAGNTMAGLSSGRMRDSNDSGFIAPDYGTDLASINAPPGAYLAAHSGSYPSSQSCNGTCPSGATAYDSVNVRLQIRVPTNAESFSYKFRFFTAEYWRFTCDIYNDFFLALLTSGAPGIPADKNISFDSLTNPVSVNNGFFEVCQAKGCYACPSGFGQLVGTGMDLDAPGAGSGLQRAGGGTEWLETTAPVIPGETITFELMVFDVGDGNLDSLVLLDDFQWSIDPSGVGTGPPG